MALDIGRFQWKRLSMGTVVASDVFQQKLDSVYIELPGVNGITDDMIIYGKNEEEHDRNLKRFLETTWKKWTKTEQGQTTIQKGYSVILWACLVSKRNLTRSKENKLDSEHGVTRRQGNNA